MSDFVTTEMHTAGNPVRIIEKGYPDIQGNTVLEKLNTLRTTMDDKRKLLMQEPRGHHDMFGAVLVSPNIKEADVGVIFMQNVGYGTMCGHAVISLGRYLIDKGIVQKPTIPETRIILQCPCGLVETYVEYNGIKTGSVRFYSVPAYVFAKGKCCILPCLFYFVLFCFVFFFIFVVSSFDRFT